jgi:spore germination protein KA
MASGYLHELIQDSPFSPSRLLSSSERPDVVAAIPLEGRIAVIVDGTPVALTLPCVFIENFHANEDYYINFYFSSISKIIRILGFMIPISVSSIHTAFHLVKKSGTVLLV